MLISDSRKLKVKIFETGLCSAVLAKVVAEFGEELHYISMKLLKLLTTDFGHILVEQCLYLVGLHFLLEVGIRLLVQEQ